MAAASEQPAMEGNGEHGASVRADRAESAMATDGDGANITEVSGPERAAKRR